MAIQPYLAMTASEFENADSLPDSVAWMACHFSPYGTGLSNLPASLPENSLLIVNDVTPIHGHSPKIIAGQLYDCIRKFGCRAVLVDFQRLPDPESEALAAHLLEALPCPTVLPESLAGKFSCPVFLPFCPLHRPLQAHISRWTGREIWLETALEETVLILNRKGLSSSTDTQQEHSDSGFYDSNLHCHYYSEVSSESVKFHLWRTERDFQNHLQLAKDLGIVHVVGLYQELRKFL